MTTSGAALFEVSKLLPEYGLTRADERLLLPLRGRNRGAVFSAYDCGD